MNILVIGKTGQVAWELRRSLSVLGQVASMGRDEVDLSNPDSFRGKLATRKPDIVINAAAYTAVDRAEDEQDEAYVVNGESVGILAEEANDVGALFVHYSTDYVFDGSKGSPYLETDQAGPINTYGRSKLAGEQAVEQVGGKYLLLRTSWVYSARGHNFLKTIIRLGQERETLSIVSDQVGSPTWARNLADATAHIVRQSHREIHDNAFESGLFHLTSSGQTSWHGFAEAILSFMKQSPDMWRVITSTVSEVSTEDYGAPARRPPYSCLDNARVASRFGIILPDWRQALGDCMDSLRQ